MKKNEATNIKTNSINGEEVISKKDFDIHIDKVYEDFENDIKKIIDKLDWTKKIRGFDGFLIDIRNVCEKWVKPKE